MVLWSTNRLLATRLYVTTHSLDIAVLIYTYTNILKIWYIWRNLEKTERQLFFQIQTFVIYFLWSYSNIINQYKFIVCHPFLLRNLEFLPEFPNCNIGPYNYIHFVIILSKSSSYAIMVLFLSQTFCGLKKLPWKV